jgi:hypothetical protein
MSLRRFGLVAAAADSRPDNEGNQRDTEQDHLHDNHRA